MYKNLLSVILIMIVSCSDNKSVQKEVKSSDTLFDIGYMGKHFFDSLIDDDYRKRKLNEAMMEGDLNSFSDISSAYGIGGAPYEFLYYDMLYAEKYNYSEAYYCIYLLLSESNYGSLMEESNFYKKYAHYNLLKAWKLGREVGPYEFKSILKGDFDSIRALKYLNKLEQHFEKEIIVY